MASTLKGHREYTMEEPLTAENDVRIVISGISGLYPQSRHVKDLCDILYEKKNPISEETCRWKTIHPEAPNFTGNILGLECFDSNFFKVHHHFAAYMDPMSRKLLEMAYEAIYDSGVCPTQLWGKKVGVYIGACFSETEKVSAYDFTTLTGYGIAGCSKTMFANRISYWLNVKGPSVCLDESCCSSLLALEQAFQALKRGECEAAIVGGANLCLHPQASIHYSRIMQLSKSGKTKSFDENPEGCARSEAINVLFIQKAQFAKRVYAEVSHIKTEFNDVLVGESGPRYGFYRNPIRVVKFLKNFYEHAKVRPQDVEYVEAFGSASSEADRSELEAIEEVFCKHRHDPLLVGSVMSNIGYGEAASGISAITKVLLGYEKGKIAANLHCENLRRDIAAIRDGKMEIVTDHKTFGRSYTAVNGFSVTGANAHVLLKGHYKPKDLTRYKSAIPHLVAISARQDSSAQKVLEDLKSRPIDPEEIALLHNVHKTKIFGHLGRGYSILSTNEKGETVSLAETVTYFDEAPRPLCFVYSGMGSQWVGMGAELMRIPIFAAAIKRCHKVLEPKGLNIVNIITSPDETMFDNILHSFVGIAAIQIGLTDIITAIGLVPDKIIGHSVGELGCAYADGCFTAEEMILAAYHRGLVSVETSFIRGSMAAVGLGYQQVRNLLPPQIQVACHNSSESSTISGPAEIMKNFITDLKSRGIFAKEVPCSNIAYHSRYIAEAGPSLLKYLTDVIKNPKPRSERWLSTSVPNENWNEPYAKYSSAEYHTNNLLSPVLFEETSQLLPNNAVLLEIAPHGLLQAILKRSLPSCKNIPLTRRGHPDNAFLVVDAIGKLYIEGFTMDIAALYPKVEFPVSTGTPMLSHLVEWAHHDKWFLSVHMSAAIRTAASMKNNISIHDDEHSYLRGHIIKGKNLYPFSGALVAVWDTLAMVTGVQRRHLAVKFENVCLYAQPPLLNQRRIRLNVTLQRGTGMFQVLNDDMKVARGYIKMMSNKTKVADNSLQTEKKLELSSDDIYDILRERDYDYKEEFRSIHKANESFMQAQIIWNDNWVTFLDGVVQLNSLQNNHDTLCLPSQIKSLSIDTNTHNDHILTADGKKLITAFTSADSTITTCGGIVIKNIKFRNIPLKEEEAATLNSLEFVPRFLIHSNVERAVQVFLQIVSENISKDKINAVKVVNTKEFDAIEIKSLLNGVTELIVNYGEIKIDRLSEKRDYFVNNIDLVFLQNLSLNDSLCHSLYCVLPQDTFIINVEPLTNDKVRPSSLYRVVSTHKTKDMKIELVKWRPSPLPPATTVVSVGSESDLSLLTSTRKNMLQQQKLVVISLYPPVSGLKDLIKEWRKDCNQIYLVMVSEKENFEQLPELHLAFSVLNNGVWGGEYYTSWQEQMEIERGIVLQSGKIGDLSTLHWVEKAHPAESGIPVTVHYVAINNFDVKKATGISTDFIQENKENSYCMDFSGITDGGERVMGILPSGAASDRIIARPELLWPVPSYWSLEDAVTVPSAYLHALYCYEKAAQCHHGLKILVHGGAGALGQAVIAIALSKSCEVFATVSNLKKKKFLMNLFPTLKEDHIGNSRDHTFADLVLHVTKGKGCDIAFSCVRGELKNDCFKSVADNGHILDTEQIYNKEEFYYGMFNLTKCKAYTQIDFYSTLLSSDWEKLKVRQIKLIEGIVKGYVQPLSRVTYSPDEVSQAFRLLASSRHRGRVLLRLHDSVLVAQPRLFCSPDSCHVVICDHEICGIQLANRLVARGVRKLHLLSQNFSTHLRFKKRVWENLGVEVIVSTEDASNNVVMLLEKSTHLGPVEGVYIVSGVVTERSKEIITDIISNLDWATRKLCPSIRYFAIANAGNFIGHQICLARVRDGLPATTISLPALRKSENDDSIQGWHSYRGAVNTIEKAIRSSHTTLLAVSQRKAKPSLLQQIGELAEITLSEDTPDHSLQDLNIDSTKIPFIQVFLRDNHSICLEETELLNLTFNKIRDLEENLSETQFKEVRGLKTFISYCDPDELFATTNMVFQTTQICCGITRDDVFDTSETNLWIIPGIEGHHMRFQVLCERLKLPAIVLQPGLDFLQESFRETAERYSKLLINKLEIKNQFYLLGYESGIIIALNIATILEELGMTGTVYCVGGTPEELQATLVDQIKEYKTEEELQDAVAKYIFTLMTGNADGLDQALKNVSSWKEKIDVCVRSLLRRVSHSTQYARALIEAAYARILRLRFYKSQPQQLRSKIILLRASSLSTGSSVTSNQEATASMQRYSKQPVVVYQLEAPLADAIYDLRCGAIINRHLDNQILEKFNNSNHCETYLLNSRMFVSNAAEANY